MSCIKLYPSGQEVECGDNDTVLSALEKAGYALPNNCRAGACGECKIKIRSGEFDQGMVMNMALSQQERDKGYALTCMAKPLSDVIEVEWGTEDAQPKLFPPRENVPFIVVERIEKTPRILELHLRPLGNVLRYWPGQYIILGDPDNGIPMRSYSIANAPRPDGEIIIQIARVKDGKTSNWIHDELKLGARVNVSGPYGTFIGDPSVKTPVLCLAAGSGLAPILSLADASLRRDFKYPVTLLFSARTEEDVYDQGLITYWQSKYRNFKFMRTLTGEQGEPPLGRIPEILKEYFPDLSEYSIFIAGSPEFVDDNVAAVKKLGAQDKLIHTEGYFQQQNPQTPETKRLLSAV